MLKRISIVLALLLCLTAFLNACANAQTGSETPTTESVAQTTASDDAHQSKDTPQESSDITYPDFKAIAQTLDVTVPKCTGLEIETELIAQVRNEIRKEIANSGVVSEDALLSGTVAEGDAVLFDYRGYRLVEGEQEDFEGGTAQKQITVAGDGNGYVPGFGKGLVGHGTEEESFVVEVTFPENYYESLAGQTVFFEMKIHGIYPDVSDEAVRIMTEEVYQSYDALFSDRLTDALKEDYAILDLIPKIDFGAAGIPEEAYRYFLQSYLDNVQQMASNYGISLETLLAYYGQTEAEFIEEATQRAIEEAETQLSIQLYFDALHPEIDNEDYEKYREELISLYLSEYSVSREVIENYLDENPEELDDFVTMQALFDYLIRENTFVAVKESADL